MRNNKKKNEKGQATALLLSLVTVTAVFLNGPKLGCIFSKAAPAGAVISMPQGFTACFEVRTDSSVEAEINTFNASENETPDSAVRQTVSPAAVNKNEFVTPDDIIEMQAWYSKKYPVSECDGAIEEMHYSSKNANVKYGNVFIKNTTSYDINPEKELEKRASLEIEDKSKPCVLIFHTHTTESYEMCDNGWYCADYATRSESEDRNMIRVGNEIEKQLVSAGFGVIHDKTVHDLKYNGAYSRSRETVEKILEQNPTIQVVLDVHRDAIYQQNGTRIKPVCVINGKKSAQVMIITGCEDGDVENFPDWRQNLVFALELQRAAENKYEGLTRPVMFCNRKYNMDVTPCSLLLEFGSDSNTLEEAVYSGFLMGRSLSSLLEEYVKK